MRFTCMRTVCLMQTVHRQHCKKNYTHFTQGTARLVQLTKRVGSKCHTVLLVKVFV